jgi:ribosomal protein L37AE/L43A
MAEYIERDQILGYLDLVVIHARGVAGNDSILKKVTGIVENMRDLVAEAPAADVVPVVHGRWVERAYGEWYCNRCGYEIEGLEYHPSVVDHNYCPRCGMRDGDSDEG